MRESDHGFSFKQLLASLTTKKAISIFVILGFIIYGNALFNGFVWDDSPYIIDNPGVHTLNIAHLFSRNLFNSGQYYRPIPALYFALLYNIFGSQAFFYHFIQVCLHVLNTILLYLALRTIFNKHLTTDVTDATEKEWNSLSGSQKVKYMRMHGSGRKAGTAFNPKTNILAFFLSLLFLVHPINVESVAYIGASQSGLFFLFGILALLVSIKEKIDLKDLFLVSGLTLLSLLTKETGVLFLFVIVCLQFFYFRKRLLQFLLVEPVALILYLFIRFVISGVAFSKPTALVYIPIGRLPLFERLASLPAIVLYYLTNIFIPLRLAVAQKWVVTNITAQNFYLPLLLDSVFFTALCLGGAYIYKLRRSYFPAYLFFFLWFASGLLFLVQIFPLDMTVADRWFYFPIVGLLGMLGVGVQTFLLDSNTHAGSEGKYNKAKMAGVLSGAVVILLFSVRTIIRNTNFHDEITLYTHDMQIQDNTELEDDLGTDYAKAGNLQAAFPHLQKSVSLFPSPATLFNLGFYYQKVGNTQRAQEYYYRAITIADTFYPAGDTHDPSDRKIYTSLVKLLLLSNEYEAAAQISTKGLQYFPDSGELWEYLALSEIKLHNQDAALAAGEKMKTLLPDELINTLYTMIVNKQEIPTIAVQAIAADKVIMGSPPKN